MPTRDIWAARTGRDYRQSPTARREEMARIIPGVPQWMEDALLAGAIGQVAPGQRPQPGQRPAISSTGSMGNFQFADLAATSPNGAFDYFSTGRTGYNIQPSAGGRRRRRRRKLLTCSDKSDIAFLHGQLGGGALGRSAISSLLSRRCG